MTGRQHHTFADAELHFARSQVGHHHRVFSNQVLRLVGAGNATEDIARLGFANIERQAQ